MDDRNLLDFLFAKSKFRMCLLGHYSRTFLIYFLVFCMCMELFLACRNDSDCSNGKCRDGICICDNGWMGEQCNHCEGRILLQEPTGHIVESTGDYNSNVKCTWLIDSGKPGATINMFISEFATECSWDYVYIYDGDSIYSNLVAAFSGPIKHDDVDIIHEVTVTSGYAYLYFYSDAAFILDGFNITYSVNTCPMGCSDHGVCNSSYLNCTCDTGWIGDDCSIAACPANCSNNGICDLESRTCLCQNGYRGRDCSIGPEEGVWKIKEGATLGRASFATVLDGNTLWVIGGYDFQSDQDITVLKHNLVTGEEEVVDAKASNGDLPEARYGHSAVMYEENLIYVYGGSLNGEMVVNDILVFDKLNSTWHNSTHNSAVTVEGHSAHVIGDVMLIIFGYSPEFGYVDFVQEYSFLDQRWTIVKTKGVQVKGAYGHSSIYDSQRKRIYVHGGYKLETVTQHVLSDELLEYNPGTRRWSILQSSSSPRFLHSAAILDNQLFVFGGNTHIDSIKSTGAKCYSDDFLAYDLDCNTWSSIPEPPDLYRDISRYGHSMFTYDGSVYVYSGFNGVMLTDMLTFHPGDCSAFDNETLCVIGSPGLSCAWNQIDKLCIPQSQYTDFNHSRALCLEPEPDPRTCSKITYCGDCVLQYGCGWCYDTCKLQEECPVGSDVCDPITQCGLYTNCLTCTENKVCKWSEKKCEDRTQDDTAVSTCSEPCEDYSESCTTCLQQSAGGCMWCESRNRCIDSNTYMTSFPYGLCLEWRTSKDECPAHGCGSYQTCNECQSSPECGWCDGEEGTGLGTCIEGSYRGPLSRKGDKSQVDFGMCPAERWFFVDCPSCQCNGHSKCVNDSVCENCQNFTTGEHCEGCQDGFFGNPVNGGSCAPCSCNNHADNCDSNNGRCYCDTKGIVGDNCDMCDSKSRYSGNPVSGGTCFYKLLMNFQYTFNLSSAEDRYYTKINMLTSPDSSNRDIEFSLTVRKPVNMTITYTTNNHPGVEMEVERAEVVKVFKTHFSRYDYDFSDDANTTFYVYLSNFTTPLWFQIVNYQPQPLLGIFIAFFATFIGILVIFGIGIKVKDVVVRRRRIQQRAVELAVMASRPFSVVNVDTERHDPPDLVANKTKKQPLAITIEPCRDNKAAVLTIFMQLPMPDGDTVPFNTTRITLASALVQLKPHHKRDRGELRERRSSNQGTRRDTREHSMCHPAEYDNPAMV